jgi:uncharacterized membrane protein
VAALQMTTRDIALTATMAAFYVVLSRLPGFPVLGVENAQIGVVSTVVPVFGLVLGPWLGASAAFFGGAASRVLFGAGTYSWLALPAMPLSAFAAGCLSRRRVGAVRGWMAAALVLGGLILAWYSTWVGQVVWVFPALHWTGLAIVLIFGEWLPFFIQRGEGVALTICVALVGFAATMVAHMYGTLAFVAATELGLIQQGILPAFFLGLIPLAAIERAIITAVVTVLGVPILLALRRQVVQSERDGRVLPRPESMNDKNCLCP